MENTYEALFQAMGQFRKLKFGDLFPDLSKAEFYTLYTILKQQKNGKITISELASKAHVLPSAMSRTLKGLEERGFVERNVNKDDRRNTYVELTEEGERVTMRTCTTMSDFGHTVMAKADEEEMCRLIAYLNNLYEIANKELEVRKKKLQDKKGKEDEEHI